MSHFGGVLAELGKAGVICSPQLFTVYHRVHVTDGGPGSAQSVIQLLQGLHQIVPGKSPLPCEQGLCLLPVLRQHTIDGRFRVFGFDL